MRVVRLVIGGLGVAGMLWGTWLLVSTQRPDQLLNVAVWLAAAVIVHDFVLVPVITVATHPFVERAERDETG